MRAATTAARGGGGGWGKGEGGEMKEAASGAKTVELQVHTDLVQPGTIVSLRAVPFAVSFVVQREMWCTKMWRGLREDG